MRFAGQDNLTWGELYRFILKMTSWSAFEAGDTVRRKECAALHWTPLFQLRKLDEEKESGGSWPLSSLLVPLDRVGRLSLHSWSTKVLVLRHVLDASLHTARGFPPMPRCLAGRGIFAEQWKFTTTRKKIKRNMLNETTTSFFKIVKLTHTIKR